MNAQLSFGTRHINAVVIAFWADLGFVPYFSLGGRCLVRLEWQIVPSDAFEGATALPLFVSKTEKSTSYNPPPSLQGETSGAYTRRQENCA